jgi:hypothetical protein
MNISESVTIPLTAKTFENARRLEERLAKDADDPAKATTPELEDRIVELNLEVRGLKNQAKERGQLLKMFVEELAVRRAEDGQPKLFDAAAVDSITTSQGASPVTLPRYLTPVGELDIPDTLSAKLRRHGLPTVENILAVSDGDVASLISHDNGGGDEDRFGHKEIGKLRKALRFEPAVVA